MDASDERNAHFRKDSLSLWTWSELLPLLCLRFLCFQVLTKCLVLLCIAFLFYTFYTPISICPLFFLPKIETLCCFRYGMRHKSIVPAICCNQNYRSMFESKNDYFKCWNAIPYNKNGKMLKVLADKISVAHSQPHRNCCIFDNSFFKTFGSNNKIR